jgi:NhaA family Na+:H+ antiporter
LILWAAVFASGVHATVAGVLLAMTVPVRTRIAEDAFIRQARRAVDDFEVAAMRTANNPDMTALSNENHHGALEDLEVLVDAARAPLIRMEHALHGIVSFLIMPLFALANAGVQFDVSSLAQSFASPITLGVIAGLLIGKPVGISLFSLLAVRIGIAALPDGVTNRMLIGASILGGIGFTMALFIGGLAFNDAAHLNAAKVGVLSASTIAALLGWFVLRGTTRENLRT